MGETQQSTTDVTVSLPTDEEWAESLAFAMRAQMGWLLGASVASQLTPAHATDEQAPLDPVMATVLDGVLVALDEVDWRQYGGVCDSGPCCARYRNAAAKA